MNPYTGTQYSLPDNPEIPQIMRRQKMAEQLLQQAQDPLQGQMVSGQFVAPSITQYLAKGLQAYMGKKGLTEADEKAAELAKALRGQEQSDIQKFMELSQGKPAQTIQPLTPNDDEGNPMPVAQAPAQAPNMGAAYAALLNSQSPGLRQAGMQGVTQLPRLQAAQQEKEAERAFRMQQLQEQHNLRMQAMQEQNANRQQMAEEQRQFMLQMKQMGGQNAQPFFQPVQTAQGVMSFNARTGKMEPVQVGGGSVVGAQYDPSLQGQLAGAKESAELRAKSGAEAQKAVKKSDVLLQQLDQAESLLKEKPTSSGIGAGIDALGNLVGVSSKGADTAAKLDSISGWLVSNVPRMEGPQSNFDVKNYQTMSGLVGDRTKPISQRMAALQEIKKLQQKYRDLNQDGSGGAQPASAPKRIRYDAQGNLIP